MGRCGIFLTSYLTLFVVYREPASLFRRNCPNGLVISSWSDRRTTFQTPTYFLRIGTSYDLSLTEFARSKERSDPGHHRGSPPSPLVSDIHHANRQGVPPVLATTFSLDSLRITRSQSSSGVEKLVRPVSPVTTSNMRQAIAKRPSRPLSQ
jgi:hypothetical protein